MMRISGNPTFGPLLFARALSLRLQGHVTSAHLEEERGRDLHFLLPLHQSRPAVLSQLFAQLELQKEALGVTSYGLSACSMEEVCLKLINVCRLLSSTVELLLKGNP